MSNTLFLQLSGYLQAWGERGRFMVRDTAQTPTKSGVIGLLCAALGQPARADGLSSALHMGVRVDQPGELVEDFHTIVSGVRKANGKLREETMVTRRFYLCDAVFMVALQGEPSLIRELAGAFVSPVYPLFLGRLCCIPSAPVFAGTGEYPNLAAALGEGRLELECDPAPGVAFRMDNIKSSAARAFRPRFVQQIGE